MAPHVTFSLLPYLQIFAWDMGPFLALALVVYVITSLLLKYDRAAGIKTRITRNARNARAA